jgi:hypothetical protein
MDIDDFCIYMEDKKRKTRLWSEAEFKRLLTTDIDREGEGPLVKIWFEKNPTRKKRTERFVQNELDEGYKTMKDPSKEDRQTLTDFALSSAASHSDRFFHGNELTPVKEAAEEVETEGLKSKKVVDVCDAATKAFEKFSKVVPGLQKLAETILSETQTRLELESRHQDSGNATQHSYRTTVLSRGKLVAMWLAEDTDDAEVRIASLTAAAVDVPLPDSVRIF